MSSTLKTFSGNKIPLFTLKLKAEDQTIKTVQFTSKDEFLALGAGRQPKITRKELDTIRMEVLLFKQGTSSRDRKTNLMEKIFTLCKLHQKAIESNPQTITSECMVGLRVDTEY